jgi:hypothetical protein
MVVGESEDRVRWDMMVQTRQVMTDAKIPLQILYEGFSSLFLIFLVIGTGGMGRTG